jgi:hypothetical protein
VKLRVLFWNIKGRDGKTAVAALEHLPALVRRHDPQILTLLEAPISAKDRLRHAGLPVHSADREQGGDSLRDLRTFRVGDQLRLRARGSDRYHRAYEAVLPGFQPLTLVSVHLQSKVNDKGDHDRPRQRADRCRTFVESVEGDVGHRRTAVYGDFNMNPFDHAMVNFDGLNAMSTSSSQVERGRTRSIL